ncbi:MAG: hypothetical protein LBF68_07405 [Christensenellaceae bacterium]|nr:hypothetical protein [Christensenellaceae bacterium]
MTKSHKHLTPYKYRNKFITLSQVVDNQYTPIPDPFLAKNQESYNKVMFIIKNYLEKYETILLSRFSNDQNP